jgi:hypothetical protein
MRYSSDIPEVPLASHASDDMLLFTAVVAIFVGFALVWMGRKGKIMWMWTWGAGLVVVSIYMGTAILFME